jgi:periplasmic protein TonB
VTSTSSPNRWAAPSRELWGSLGLSALIHAILLGGALWLHQSLSPPEEPEPALALVVPAPIELPVVLLAELSAEELPAPLPEAPGEALAAEPAAELLPEEPTPAEPAPAPPERRRARRERPRTPEPEAAAEPSAPDLPREVALLPNPAPDAPPVHLNGGTNGTAPRALDPPRSPPSDVRNVARRATSSRELSEFDRGALVRGYTQTISTEIERGLSYPNRARRQRIEGTVVLEITIDSDGRILAVLVVRSSGHAVLDRAAEERLQQLGRFSPPPVALAWEREIVRVPVHFRVL